MRVNSSILGASIVTLCLAGIGMGQGTSVWGEVGQQQNRFGSSPTIDKVAYGFGLQSILGGTAKRNFGVLVPVGFEIRGSGNFESADLLGSGDLAFRIRNVSFGPGANFGYIFRQSVADATCGASGAASFQSSCLAGSFLGKRDIGNFYGLGLSGFAKVNFGPQGRAFLQGKYIYYAPDWVRHLSGAEFVNNTLGTSFDLPTDFPEFNKGRDLRLSAGYVFGGGDSMAKIVRVQYNLKQFDFNRENGNLSGVFDQKTGQLTFGFGVGF